MANITRAAIKYAVDTAHPISILFHVIYAHLIIYILLVLYILMASEAYMM